VITATIKKILALTAASFLACAAQAQVNPPGSSAPPATPGLATGKTEASAEARKARRAPKPVRQPVGDLGASAESSLNTADKTQVAAEHRVASRDQRHPGLAKTGQGGTPE